MVASFLQALELGLLIVMAVSPAIFLLCIANTSLHKLVSVGLFVVSLAGFIGLKYNYEQDVRVEASPNSRPPSYYDE